MIGGAKKKGKRSDDEDIKDGHHVLQEALSNIRIVKSCNAE